MDQARFFTIPTRRHLLVAAAAIGGLAASGDSVADPAPPDGSAANKLHTSLHQDVTLAGSPRRLYDILLDSKQFAAFSGLPADIDPAAGGAFTLFGGLIVGRTVELVPGQRIVQAWRPAHWEPGVYSLVTFSFSQAGAATMVALDHKGFPKGEFDDLSAGWKSYYWDRLKKYLA